MENTIRFIINADGTHKVSNRGILRALSQYDTKLYIITPLPLETSIRVNYLIHERHDIRTQQYLTPVVNMKGCDLVSELESIYQEVADWNVFGCSINPLAYSKISKYRSGRIGISFTISQVLNVEGNPNLTNYKGLIGSNGDIPSGTYQNGDYFECDTFNFFSQTLNKRLTQGSIAYFKDNAWHELERFEVIKNTTTENVAVDPACLAETPPATEETINEILASYTGAVAETVDDINTLRSRVNEVESLYNNLDADFAQKTHTHNYDDLEGKPDLFSGSYDDLTDKPTIFSGDYDDLTNKPTIPTKVSELENDKNYADENFVNQNIAVLESKKADKTELFSGDYGDLLNTPTIPTKTSQLVNDSGLATETYVDNKVSSVYKYKGSVPTFNDLPKTNRSVGDVYDVQDSGMNYAWSGTVWDELGGYIDLSNYYSKDETFSQDEINYLLGNKASLDHNHDNKYAKINHDHDDAYYQKRDTYTTVQVNNLLLDYSKTNHNHDTEYYKKADTYSKTQTDTLLNGKSNANHNHDTKYANINHNHDTKYADINHNHNTEYYQKTETYNKTEIDEMIPESVEELKLWDTTLFDKLLLFYGGWSPYTIINADLGDLSTLNATESSGGMIKAMAVDDTYIYIGDASETVKKYLKEDLSFVAESPDFGGYISTIAIDDTYIYVGGGAERVKKYLKSDLSYIGQSPMYGNSGDPIQSIAIDDTYIYAGGYAEKVSKYLKSDLSHIGDTYYYGGSIQSIAIDDTHIYVGGYITRTVRKYLKNDLSYVGETPNYGGEINTIAIDDTHIYVGGATTNTVRKYLKSDLSFVGETENYGGFIYSIVVYDNYLYVGGYATQRVRKYLKTDLSYVAESPDYDGAIRVIAIG